MFAFALIYLVGVQLRSRAVEKHIDVFTEIQNETFPVVFLKV